MEYNSEFLDNIEFFIMCRDIISSNHKYGGCLVRQHGCLTASLETYLDFWFNCLPFSIDSQCRPICAISTDGICYVRNDNHELEAGDLNMGAEEVVRKFVACKKLNKTAHDNPSLGSVICSLRKAIGDNSIDPQVLIGWQQFFMPAKISALEFRNKRLENENSILRASLAGADEVALAELSKYKELFRERESRFNRHIESCERYVRLYQDFLFKLKNGLDFDPCSEPDKSTLLKMAKDAIRYYKQRKGRMVRIIYHDVPSWLTDLPICSINQICGINLQS